MAKTAKAENKDQKVEKSAKTTNKSSYSKKKNGKKKGYFFHKIYNKSYVIFIYFHQIFKFFHINV